MRKLVSIILLYLLSLSFSYSQTNVVTGTVLSSENSAPLNAVTVRVKGKTKGVITNAEGKYSINAGAADVIEFISVGYRKEERLVGNEKVINVILFPGESDISDVVVTAYGTQRAKKGLGYQVQTVGGEEIAETQRDNWINALTGRVAGANITPSSGAPGASTSIVLRGPVSLGGNNQPLFVIDGVPYDNQTINQDNLIGNAAAANRNSDYGNRAADINPNDIENITILKGPEASALYGSEGASGAIVITTKKGKSGRAVVSYDNSFRIEKVYRFPEIQQVYARGSNGFSV